MTKLLRHNNKMCIRATRPLLKETLPLPFVGVPGGVGAFRLFLYQAKQFNFVLI